MNWEQAEREYNKHYDPYDYEEELCECEECGEEYEEDELTWGICSNCQNDKDTDFSEVA
jgi:Zn finger protein HypA/HybF involved in hydrogenase expression